MTTTAESDYVLDVGDICWVDLEPVRGTEQSGIRPALILSPRLFHQHSRRSIICPITSNMTPWFTKVFLPEDACVQGAVLVDQVRSVDRTQRGFRLIGRAPEAVMAEVRGRLSALLGFELTVSVPIMGKI